MRKKNQNILITGASGFVGRVLTKRLSKINSNLFLVSQDKDFKFPGAKIFYGDLVDKDFCRRILRKIDIVYYLAGYKRNSLHHAQRAFDFTSGNISPLLVFLKELANSKVKKLVYLSSTFADLETNELIKDGYALGKFINEIILKSFIRQFNFPCVIVRSTTIYGPGDNFVQKTANFIPTMIEKIQQAHDEAVVWGNGKRKMQFIYVDDLVSNFIAAKDGVKDFYVFGNQQEVSVEKIALMIAKFLHKDIKIKYDLTKPDKPTRLFKFDNLIQPETDIGVGLRETIEYYQKLERNG